MNAYEIGWNDYLVSHNENPFNTDTQIDNYLEWINGWNDAFDYYQRKNSYSEVEYEE